MRLSLGDALVLGLATLAAIVIAFAPDGSPASTPAPTPAPTTCYSWTAAPYNGTFCGPKADMNIQIGKAP